MMIVSCKILSFLLCGYPNIQTTEVKIALHYYSHSNAFYPVLVYVKLLCFQSLGLTHSTTQHTHRRLILPRRQAPRWSHQFYLYFLFQLTNNTINNLQSGDASRASSDDWVMEDEVGNFLKLIYSINNMAVFAVCRRPKYIRLQCDLSVEYRHN